MEEEKKEETKVEAGESEVKPGPETETPQDSGAEPETETPAEEEKPADPEESSSVKATEDKPEDKPAEPDWKALYALTLADFDNYKKRAARDREDTYRYAEMDILKDILPVVDNLSLALANAKEKSDDPRSRNMAPSRSIPSARISTPRRWRRLRRSRRPMSPKARSRLSRRRAGC